MLGGLLPGRGGRRAGGRFAEHSQPRRAGTSLAKTSCTAPKNGMVWKGNAVAAFSGIKTYADCCRGEACKEPRAVAVRGGSGRGRGGGGWLVALQWRGDGGAEVHRRAACSCSPLMLLTFKHPASRNLCRVSRCWRVPPLPRRPRWLLPLPWRPQRSAGACKAWPQRRWCLAGRLEAGVSEQQRCHPASACRSCHTTLGPPPWPATDAALTARRVFWSLLTDYTALGCAPRSCLAHPLPPRSLLLKASRMRPRPTAADVSLSPSWVPPLAPLPSPTCGW